MIKLILKDKNAYFGYAFAMFHSGKTHFVGNKDTVYNEEDPILTLDTVDSPASDVALSTSEVKPKKERKSRSKKLEDKDDSVAEKNLVSLVKKLRLSKMWRKKL